MNDEGAKQAAEEFLAARFAEETEAEEERLNREAAVQLAPKVWKGLADTVTAQCKQWNTTTGEESLSCKETILGDLRVRCAGRPQQITIHYDSRKRQVTITNTARLESDPDSLFEVGGINSGREATLFRNKQPVNIEMIVLGELRVLAGLARRNS
jgi:hypothetical protein